VQAEIASLRQPHGRESLPCARLRAAIRLNLSVRRYSQRGWKLKLKFKGWNREVFTHKREIAPLLNKDYRYSVGEPGQPLRWETSTLAHGRITGLGLSGDFRIDFEFDLQELKNWLSVYIREHPTDAIRLLGEMQAEAINALF